MESQVNPLFNFTLRDTFRVLFRHKYRAAIVVCGLLGLTLAALVMMPRTYESEAKLFVRVGNETMSVDPSVNPDKSISVQVAREEEIKSLIDLFRSHSVAEEVVARLGADVVVRQSFEPPKEPGQIDKWIDSAMGVVAKAIGSADVTIEERATRVVVESIRISAQPKSTVVQLAAEAATPQFAQKLAETYVDAMLDKHVQAHRTAQTLPFFEQQADALKLQVDEATKQLQHLKNHFGLVSVEGQKTIVEGQISSIEREILNAQTDMQAYTEKIKTLRLQHPDLPETSAKVGSSLSPQSLDDMRNQLYTLQLRAGRLSSTLTEAHPDRVAVTDELKQAEHDLNVQELQFAKANVSTAIARVASLEVEQNALAIRLSELNEGEQQISQLRREVDLLQQNYNTYATNREASRIAEERRRQQITNINVIQEATFIESPAAPRRSIIFVLGCVAAICGGLAVALASEMLDHTLKTPEEVEERLELPVLLSIPSVDRRQVMMN